MSYFAFVVVYVRTLLMESFFVKKKRFEDIGCLRISDYWENKREVWLKLFPSSTRAFEKDV